jgi:protein arginine N-methyltransferase 5
VCGDVARYERYQEAVKQALLDRVPEADRATKVTTIMVVGAGRGPLVQCAIDGAKEAGCKVKMFAIEKNPNAVVTLEVRAYTTMAACRPPPCHHVGWVPPSC